MCVYALWLPTSRTCTIFCVYKGFLLKVAYLISAMNLPLNFKKGPIRRELLFTLWLYVASKILALYS